MSVGNKFSKLVSDAVALKNILTEKKKRDKTKKKSKTKNGSEPSNANINANGNILNISRCSNIHIGNNFIYGSSKMFGSNVPEPETSSPPELSERLEDTFSSIEEVSDDVCLRLSKRIGDHWKDLGASLGFTDSALEEYSSKDQDIFTMLTDWKMRNSVRATVGWLCKSLWEAKEYDAAQFLSSQPSC